MKSGERIGGVFQDLGSAVYGSVPFLSAFTERSAALADEDLPKSEHKRNLAIQAGLLGAARLVTPLAERAIQLHRELGSNGEPVPGAMPFITAAAGLVDMGSFVLTLAVGGGVLGFGVRELASQFVFNLTERAIRRSNGIPYPADN